MKYALFLSLATIVITSTSHAAPSVSCNIRTRVEGRTEDANVNLQGQVPLLVEVDGRTFSVEERRPKLFLLNIKFPDQRIVGASAAATTANQNAGVSDWVMAGPMIAKEFSDMSCQLLTEPSDLASQPEPKVWPAKARVEQALLTRAGNIEASVWHGSGCGKIYNFKLKPGYADDSRVYVHLVFETDNGCEAAAKKDLLFTRDQVLKAIGKDAVGKTLILVDGYMQAFNFGKSL